MQVANMIDAAPDDVASRTPPCGGADSEGNQGDQADNESGDDDGPAKKKVSRGRRTWTELGSWDRTSTLDSEIDHQVSTLANQRMEESGLVEWPRARRRDDNHCLGPWVRTGQRFRQGGRVSIETHYCPLKSRMDCKAQIRVTRSSTLVCQTLSG